MKIQKDISVCGNKWVKLTLILLITIITAPPSFAQQRERGGPPPLRERIFFGGSAALSVGTITNIEVSPLVGLWLLPPLAVAAGPTFMFYKDYYGKTNIIGGRIYSQFVIIRDLNQLIPLGIHTSIFFHAEDEMLSLESAYWKNITIEPSRFIINTALIGGGIGQPLGARSSFNIMVLWALNDSGYGIYSNPEIRIGFIF